MGSRTGPDEVNSKKILPLPGLELRPLGRPARSQSLYRLRYHDFLISDTTNILNIRYGFLGGSSLDSDKRKTIPVTGRGGP
jgi:hypothetical protein